MLTALDSQPFKAFSKLYLRMASQTTEEAEFWERLENIFDRKIPIDPQVKYAMNEAIKETRKQEPDEAEEVINAVLYLAHDIVSVAFRDKDAEVAYDAKKIAADFIAKKLEESKKTVPSPEETETESEAKGIFNAKRSPGDFLEQFVGIKKLERKGGPKEQENMYHIINIGVTNIYLDIIKKFVEENKQKIFHGNDYQTLKEKREHLLHFKSGLPTFQGSTHCLWNRVIHYLKNDIERFKVSFPSGETHSNECDEAFSKARKELLDEAEKTMLYAFGKFESSIKAGGTDVEKKDTMQKTRNKLLKDPEIEQLGKNIEKIIYPDIEEMPYGVFVDMPYGVFVDRRALNLWKKEGGSMKEFFDFIEKVREMFHKLPEFVVRWGEWAYKVSKKVNSPGAAS
ncbi:hypothetical protein AWC38_SpisGene24349 [Stylophora pistillata]|uniref:Uncharacterized protein n=1 Tax=Stylophora pistillata TaxID=50429 RepID=A0A2B4R2E5_STYPI|nr:hypothetical protein AWC38_SpisGene24349 [Stylophora pistillata]